MKKTEYDKIFTKEKTLLFCLAAMFENEVSIDWLEELTGMKASQILSILEEGVQLGFLVRKKPAVYNFKNGGSKQEWLQKLEDEEQKKYHRSITDILLRELPDDNSKALEIAGHLLHVAKDWKECQWLVRAGEIYARSFLADKAITCFSKVLRVLSDHRGENEDWLFIKAAIEHSNIFAARSDTETSLSFLREARERARKLHKKSYELLLEMHIAKYERFGSEFGNALKRFEAALSQAEQIDDPELTSATALFSTYFLFWQGRFRDVIEVYERSVPDVDKYPVGHFPIIAAMMVGHCYTMIGQFTQGLGMLDAIRDYCLKKGDLYLSAHSGWVIAMAMLSINRLEDSLRYLKLCLREAEQSGNKWVEVIATLIFSLIHCLMGNKKESLQYLRKFLKNNNKTQNNLLVYPYLAELCWAMENGELLPVQGFSLEHEIDRMLKLKNIFLKGIAYRYQALLGKSKGWPNQKIGQLLTLSAKWLQESGYQIELAKTHIELARYYLSIKNEKRAKTTIKAAYSIFSSMNTEMIPDDLRALNGGEDHEKSVIDEIFTLVAEMTAKEENKKLLQQTVTTANRIIGAERGALLLFEEETNRQKLQIRASKNLTMEQIYDPAFAASMKMIGEVIDSGNGRIMKIGPAGDTLSNSKETACSGICVPVVLHEKIIGVLYHENRLLLNVFKESDLKLLKFFAALAAIHLDNIKKQEEVTKLHEKNQAEEIIW